MTGGRNHRLRLYNTAINASLKKQEFQEVELKIFRSQTKLTLNILKCCSPTSKRQFQPFNRFRKTLDENEYN